MTIQRELKKFLQRRKINKLNREQKAILIQRNFKSFLQRRKTKRRIKNKAIILIQVFRRTKTFDNVFFGNKFKI